MKVLSKDVIANKERTTQMKIVSAEGQTCNQFWIYSNYIADCLEAGEKMIILAPDISIIDYPTLLNNDIIKFPLYSDFFCKLIGYKRYINLLQKIFANKYARLFYSFFFQLIPFVNYIDGKMAGYRSKYRIKQKENLTAIFTPNVFIINTVTIFINNIRTHYDMVIGIHVRRGDYKTWLNGKYFYSDEEYHSVMLKIQSLFSNKKVAFFISSNERLDIECFKDCSCFILPKSSTSMDLYGLSISDYIVGPPSSFSAWASFYGEVPLYILENFENKITLDSFKDILNYWSKNGDN